jgi:hypothetical protein
MLGGLAGIFVFPFLPKDRSGDSKSLSAEIKPLQVSSDPKVACHVSAEHVPWMMAQGWVIENIEYDTSTIPPTAYFSLTKQELPTEDARDVDYVLGVKDGRLVKIETTEV